VKILVDSCVWSLALRRREMIDDPFAMELRELIPESDITLNLNRFATPCEHSKI
jgi:hypothetical protein